MVLLMLSTVNGVGGLRGGGGLLHRHLPSVLSLLHLGPPWVGKTAVLLRETGQCLEPVANLSVP